MGFTNKYNQLIIIIIITFFLILSKFNNSAVVINAPPSICNGKTHNVDNEAKNIYGLQCKNDGTHDCIVCFESSNIVISKNIEYDIYFYGNLKILNNIFEMNKLDLNESKNQCVIRLK